MKRTFILVVMMAMILGFSMQAHAALELRGTDVYGNRLIYDSDFNITWYDYSNSTTTWQNQMNWASALSVSGGNLVGVYDDWRLPTALNQDGTWPCQYYNCTGSEMGHLFYTELGNVAYPQSLKTGDFQHLGRAHYWSGTEYVPDAAGYFNTNDGGQYIDYNDGKKLAIAVRPGDVSVAVVPEPMSMILFGAGGIVMGGRWLVKKRRG